MKVLVTGGAGYIGSCTVRALEGAGHTPVILDSLVTGQRSFIGDRLFYEADVADVEVLEQVRRDHPDLGGVIHMAALVVVPESVAEPGRYYRENVTKSLELFDWLASRCPVPVIFSSSASVYAHRPDFRVREDDPVAPGSPYASSKAMMERMLADVCTASGLRGISLRYFNPIGAAPDLSCGVHVAQPSHVLGQLVMAATGEIDGFTLTGTALPTRDGTGVRDYVHVWDLARAHVLAIEQVDAVMSRAQTRHTVVNLGTGSGVTVRELIAAFERATGLTVPVREAPPRPGDVVGAYADIGRAVEWLGWRPSSGLADGIQSALDWARKRESVVGTGA